MTTSGIAIGYLIVLGALVWHGLAVEWLFVITIIMSLITLFLFAGDKAAATRGAWRTSEKQLLLASILGGWPGGLLAQHWFRHKTRKGWFQFKFFLVTALNVALVALVVFGPDKMNSILQY